MSDSAFTMVTVVPPSGVAPSQLNLGPQQYQANGDGSFTIDSRLAPALIAAGWGYKLTGNPPTHAP